MKIDGRATRTIWLADDGKTVEVIDQTKLPFEFSILQLTSVEQAASAIERMVVRGAPLIGATAAYGVAIAMADDASSANLDSACIRLLSTRPTAVNLRWALDRMKTQLADVPQSERRTVAYQLAADLCDEDVVINSSIGNNGLSVLKQIVESKPANAPVNVLTHCNAGWLATVDWGTATAPIYMAHDLGISVHVWVDETRPRNQGASLTAFELGHHGVPHTVIPDNTGGHLMQHGQVDLVITGTDRTTASGDVCNKIGTYLKALAAKDNRIPFYVALPSPTIDFTLDDGIAQIPIEQRSDKEVTHVTGIAPSGAIETVDIVAKGSPVANFAFDVTPARLVTGLITEAGVCEPTKEAIASMFPERVGSATVSSQ